MKKILNYIIVIAIISSCLLVVGCDDDKKGLIQSVGIKEAVYNTSDKKMIISLKDDATLQLTPLIYPMDAANHTLKYEHKYPDLMEVSSTGLITGKKFGTDTLTVSTTDGSNISVNYRIILIDHMVKATSVVVTAAGRNMNIEAGKTFNLGETVSLAPADVWDKSITYKSKDETIATVNSQGIVTAIGSIGQTTQITVTATDGSEVYTDCNVTIVAKMWKYTDLERVGWSVLKISHNRPADAAITNDEDSHIDDNAVSCLALIKPGKSYGGITVGLEEEVYFILNLGKVSDINYFRILHRNNKNANLRVHEVALYGSNDGTNFTLIKDKISTGADFVESAEDNTGNVVIPDTKYQYIKMSYTKWTESASTMQIAEFYLGHRE